MHILRNILLFLVPIMITTSGLAQVKTFNKRLHLGQRTMVLGALHATDTAYYATGIVVDTVTPGSNTAALFLKFDLEGNPLNMKIIADSTPARLALQSLSTGRQPVVSHLRGGEKPQ